MLLGMISLSAMAQGIVVHQTNSENTTFKTTDVSSIEFTENQVETSSSKYATKEELQKGLDTKADKTELAVKANLSVLEQALMLIKSLEAKVEYLKKDIDVPNPPGVEAVDLGLPSGVKWANMNVEASKPEDSGAYYAWGETESKGIYSWNSYKWYEVSKKVTKYCTRESEGTVVDNKTVLDPEDDVAHLKWDGNWRIPTDDEFTELRTKCKWTWDDVKKGYTVVGPNGKSIFFPAGGMRDGTSLRFFGTDGNYWSASLYSDSSLRAGGLTFSSTGFVSVCYAERYNGWNIRPVR